MNKKTPIINDIGTMMISKNERFVMNPPNI